MKSSASVRCLRFRLVRPYPDACQTGKGTSDERLTYLLRPNATRPSKHMALGLETPPFTDLESSTFEYTSESDFPSDREFLETASDTDGPTRHSTHADGLSTIAEIMSVPATPNVVPIPSLAQDLDDSWSVLSDDVLADGEMDDSADEVEHVPERHPSHLLLDSDNTPRGGSRLRNAALRAQVWDRQRRSASSPSRSPARRVPSRPPLRKDPHRTERP